MIDIESLPPDPGCYLFRDASGEIIYIGKAKNIRKRVSSYFQKRPLDAKTENLVARIASADFVATNNEIEALILENNLIKRHQPKYNINLKDAKNFAYIQITDDEFPRITIARRPNDAGRFFGPFVSAQERNYVLLALKRAFRLRTCKRLPKKACLRYHMQSCSAPCIGAVSRDAYQESVKRAEAVLKGNSTDLLHTLRLEMAEKAREQAFEKALELRDQIAAIEQLAQHQSVERQKTYDEDIIHYLVMDDRVYLIVFTVHRGTLAQKEEFVFDLGEEFLEEFITQYYSDHEPPTELILPRTIDTSLAEFLSMRKGRSVRITVPQKGEKKKLLDLVKKNIELAFFGDRIKLEELKLRLRLPGLPMVIECFDISHLSGTSTVGAMVQFRGGKPDKRNYRRFRIKTVEGVDDTAAIAEIVKRRYQRLAQDDAPLPDLIVIDGGKGQLSAAMDALKALGLRIPIIAIAKREEEIYVPGLQFPLPLQKKEKASLFIQEIRDEAHRFAITYHRLLRKKKIMG